MEGTNQGLEIVATIDHLFEPDDQRQTQTLAFCSVTLGGHFTCHEIRVVKGRKGPFVSLPSRKYKGRDGDFRYAEYFHPVTKEGREALNAAVLDAYYEAANARNEKE